MLFVGQDQPVVTIHVDAEFRPVGGLHHGLEGFFPVEVGDAFGQGVGNHRRRTVADHAVGFVGTQLPTGQFALFFIDREHRFDEIDRPLPLDQIEQRMQCPVRIPKREDMVAVPAVRAVDLVVHAAVFPVCVGVEAGGDGRVIERRIKDALRRVVAFHLDFREEFVPGLAG